MWPVDENGYKSIVVGNNPKTGNANIVMINYIKLKRHSIRFKKYVCVILSPIGSGGSRF